jgi:hypothetical protein
LQPAGFQHLDIAEHVDLRRFNRLVEGIVQISQRGKVINRIAAFDGFLERLKR